MNTLSLLLLASLASAQNRAAEIDFQNQLDSLRLEQKKVNDRAAAVEQTFVGMNDGVDVGGQVHDYIKERRISVVYAPLQGGIVIPEKTAAYPRAIAPILARYAAEKTFADMPDCAEKQYMILSWEARSWIELGGDPKALPVIEHLVSYQDVELADRMKLWLAGGMGREMALDNVARATNTKKIYELEDNASKARLAELSRANKRFTQFLADEDEWRRGYGQMR